MSDLAGNPEAILRSPVELGAQTVPEDGWLEWRSPTILWERAPSGAYVEEWERLPDDRGVAVHFTAPDASSRSNLYLAGRHVFLAIERTNSAEAGDPPLHEFSYGRSRHPTDPSSATVELSTIAERVGTALLTEDCDHAWQPVSCRTTD